MQPRDLATLVTPRGRGAPRGLLALPGVHAVSVDGHRDTVSVRFDPRLIEERALHAALRPLPTERGARWRRRGAGLAYVVHFVRARAG